MTDAIWPQWERLSDVNPWELDHVLTTHLGSIYSLYGDEPIGGAYDLYLDCLDGSPGKLITTWHYPTFRQAETQFKQIQRDLPTILMEHIL